MRTNVNRRLSSTAGIAVVLIAAALSAGLASPASANEASASPTPTVTPSRTPLPTATPPSPTPLPTVTASPTPLPTASTTPSTTASPTPTATPGCTDKTVTITGRVWNDLNHNGIQDASEPGLPNIPLLAYDDVGLVAAKKAPGLRSPQIRKALTKYKAQGVNPKADDEFPGVFTDKAGNYTIAGKQAGPIMVAIIPVTVVNDEVVEDWLLTDFERGDDRARDSDFFGEDGWGWSYHESTEPCERVDVDGGLYKTAGQPTSSAPVTPAPGNGGGGPLPNTGLAIGGFLVAGVALIGGGTALTIVARRRRRAVA